MITITSGTLLAPGIPENSFTVPFGFAPRFILPYIIGEAVRGPRTVNMGNRLHQFPKVIGISSGSKNYHTLNAQLLNISACQISITRIKRNRQKRTEDVDINLLNISERIRTGRLIPSQM